MKKNKTEKILEGIKKTAKKIGRKVNLMEVCGTHTQVVSRFGLRELMPKNVNLVTGPGCPVCVTDQKDIDFMIELSRAGIPVAVYGDLIRVPGSGTSLEKERAMGAKVFPVYSVLEALEIQRENNTLVFCAIGFETTAPATAFAIQKGLNVFSVHKFFLPAMEVLLKNKKIKIDGFLDPGHVSVIIGTKPYSSMKVSQVVTGFEKEDVLLGIFLLLKQIDAGNKVLENEYKRAVKEGGNKKILKTLDEVFVAGDGVWRGLGVIPKSGMNIRKKFEKFDAKKKYKNLWKKVQNKKSSHAKKCRCGEIIQGMISPRECPFFKKACTPENPLGPCMVSVEGACNVMHRHK